MLPARHRLLPLVFVVCSLLTLVPPTLTAERAAPAPRPLPVDEVRAIVDEQ